MIPEAQDLPAKTVQICGSVTIKLVAVLSAIGFDNEAALHAREIGDAAPDRLLPAKLEAFELSVRKMPPQAFLGLRWVVAHFAGAAVQFGELFG